MDTLLQDLRYALRTLRNSPGFTAVAVITLALGIGANTALFSVVNEVLLKSLQIPQPDKVVMLWPRNPSRNIPVNQVTPALYEDWRTQNHVFSEMACAADQSYTLTGAGQPDSLVSWRLSANFMHVLGVKPFLGRMFTPEEDQPGHEHVVVLTYKLWQRKFGSDSSILNKTVTLNDTPYIVIGVMPRGFNFPGDVNDIWTPLALRADLSSSRSAHILRVVARIKEGVSMQQAQNDMEQLSSRLAALHPDTDKGWDVFFRPVKNLFVGDVRTPLLALMGAVGFVLLIACANLANLLLARSGSRRREIAIRVSLGASHARIMRQVLTESVLLSLFGSAAGLICAAWSSGLLLHLFPQNIANLRMPHVDKISVGGIVITFSVLLALVTGLLFGMVPALQVRSVSPDTDLREGAERIVGSGSGSRLRPTLVVAQVSLALVLLACAGLMIKSFLRLQRASLGFNPDHVLTMQVVLPQSRYRTDPERSKFVQDALSRIEPLPGVQSAAAVNFLPLSGFWGTLSFQTTLAPNIPVSQWPEADYRIASTDYFRTMQIRVLRGRVFSAQDTAESPLVCVINQTLAQQYFHDEDPVGRYLTPDPGGFGKKPFLIVGVIADVKHFGAAEPTHAELYRPFMQDGFRLIAFTIRTKTEPMALADSVRNAIWSLDKDQSIFRVLPMEDAVAQSSALRRTSMAILAFFAVTALVLAAVGIYGVISFLVIRRTREMGIRMALGARRSDILRMIVGQSLRVVL
ncbi:MAG TPA: ABC transporter permease, partial [Terriglobales bacterium]|nr:ABC transporter permease [Terriglobales bacterium]